MTKPVAAYAVALVRAAGLLCHEARKHENAQAEIEAEDPQCEEARMHALEAECLRRAAGLILDLPNPYGAPTVTAPEPDIRF